MAEPWLTISAGCVLLSTQTSLNLDGDFLKEVSSLNIANTQDCTEVIIPLADGVSLIPNKSLQRNSDGTKIKIKDYQWEQSKRTPTGEATVTVHLPAMRKGDRAKVAFTRRWPADTTWTWTPGYPSSEKASLRIDSKLQSDNNLKSTRLEHPERHHEVSIRRRASSSPELPAPDYSSRSTPQKPVVLNQTLKLQIPAGDPMLSLWPGGGSSYELTEELLFAAETTDRLYPIPLPPGANNIEWRVTPQGSAQVIERIDDLVLLMDSSEGPSNVLIRYQAPDAPSYGTLPRRENTKATLTVHSPGGRVQWEPNKENWRLASIDGRPILPNRDTLLKSIDARYRAASIPEPGLPLELRGIAPSWELAEQLREVLLERVKQATWPSDVLWPRPLYKARQTEALTPVEAAIILQRYAEQAGFTAAWYLVRLESSPDDFPTSPAGFTEAIVRISWNGENHWIDPFCATCGAFELRPALYDRAVLGFTETATPPLPVGASVMEVHQTGIDWKLHGPPALALRQQLSDTDLKTFLETELGLIVNIGQEVGIENPGDTIHITMSSDTPVQPENLTRWLSTLQIDTHPNKFWLGTHALRVHDTTCDLEPISEDNWRSEIKNDYTTWTITHALNPDALKTLTANLANNWPGTGTCE